MMMGTHELGRQAAPRRGQRGATIERQCKRDGCNKVFTARVADIRRGWAKFCSKSCKAITQVQKGGQYVRYQQSNDNPCRLFPDDDAMNCQEESERIGGFN